MDLTPTLKTARAAAEAAGKILREYFRNLETAQVETKHSDEGYDGMVTLADVEAEQSIIDLIRTEFPNHQFLAEESVESGQFEELNSAEHLWIIDPLDGTNNFAHRIPHYAVSVAYYHHGQPKVGVVLRPESDQWYWSVAGQGAFIDQDGATKRASVNRHAKLSETMIGVGFYYDRGEMMRDTLETVERLFAEQIHGIRRMGTAALDIVQVGAGQFGAFFEYQLSPWDFAAARLFLEEAGGTISTCEGEPLPIKKSSVLASNGWLHDSMLAIVRRTKNQDSL